MDGEKKQFYRQVRQIALPVTAQSLLQSSFSVVDQLMIGRLGSAAIAGVGLGGKFSSIYSVLLGAVSTAAGIMMAQYLGKRDGREMSRSFFVCLFLSLGLAGLFSLCCLAFPARIMWLYTKDGGTNALAASYLRIVACSFVPMAVNVPVGTLLRCMEKASLPLYASIAAVAVNTGLNYLLIFGRLGLPALGVNGAAIATVLSQLVLCLLSLCFLWRQLGKRRDALFFACRLNRDKRRQYLAILAPILACEFFWSLGENVYAAIYGNMGTDDCAAMTLTVPVQVLLMGALGGLSQAAAILVGKSLGKKDYDGAYRDSRRLMLAGLAGSLLLSALLVILGRPYAAFYDVAPEVRRTAYLVLVAFAVISPVKVQNMVLGGGIIRSGGKTSYIMVVDFVGTWFFGVPLGLLAAFVLRLPVPAVYFLLSLEECVRFAITLLIFRTRKWMVSLET